MNLQPFIADTASDFARIKLRHAALERHLHPLVLHLRSTHRQQPRRVEFRRHRRKLELNGLKFADRLAELPPLGRILHRSVQRSASNAEAQSRN